MLKKVFPTRSVIDFDNIINTPNIKDSIICREERGDERIAFLISWADEQGSYYLKSSPEDRSNIFSIKCKQRFRATICSLNLREPENNNYYLLSDVKII